MSASNRFDGGMRRSIKSCAAFNKSSFLTAIFQMIDGIRLACLVSKPLKMSSQDWSKKLIITQQDTTLTANVQVVCTLADELVATHDIKKRRAPRGLIESQEI